MNFIISCFAGYCLTDADISKKDLAVIVMKTLACVALICGACILLDIICH